MSPLAAVSLDMGLNLSTGMTQPASTLLFILHLEKETQTSKQTREISAKPKMYQIASF